MYQKLSLTLNLSDSVVTLIARMTLRTALGRDYLGQWGTCLCLEGSRWFWQGFNLDHCVCNLTDHHFSLISPRMLGMIRLSLTTVGLTSIGLQMVISRFLFTTMINFTTIYWMNPVCNYQTLAAKPWQLPIGRSCHGGLLAQAWAQVWYLYLAILQAHLSFAK